MRQHFSPGAEAIVRERERQVTQELYDGNHDDGHRHGQLAICAAVLATKHTNAQIRLGGEDIPDWWNLALKHQDPLRRLEIAGALIAAEIDRLRRRE